MVRVADGDGWYCGRSNCERPSGTDQAIGHRWNNIQLRCLVCRSGPALRKGQEQLHVRNMLMPWPMYTHAFTNIKRVSHQSFEGVFNQEATRPPWPPWNIQGSLPSWGFQLPFHLSAKKLKLIFQWQFNTIITKLSLSSVNLDLPASRKKKFKQSHSLHLTSDWHFLDLVLAMVVGLILLSCRRRQNPLPRRKTSQRHVLRSCNAPSLSTPCVHQPASYTSRSPASSRPTFRPCPHLHQREILRSCSRASPCSWGQIRIPLVFSPHEVFSPHSFERQPPVLRVPCRGAWVCAPRWSRWTVSVSSRHPEGQKN